MQQNGYAIKGDAPRKQGCGFCETKWPAQTPTLQILTTPTLTPIMIPTPGWLMY